jgi:hypothetical protein
MINVQPFTNPCQYIYWMDTNYKAPSGELTCRIESVALGTSTFLYDFKFFTGADFDKVKEAYADAIANGIDAYILSKLPGYTSNVKYLFESESKLSETYDFIIAPAEDVDEWRKQEKFDGIDFFDSRGVLDPKIFVPKYFIGKYPSQSTLIRPIFCPYIIVVEGTQSVSGTGSVMMRCGWLD